MFKKLIISALFLLLFLLSNQNVQAQGTFTCYWNGPQIKCDTQFTNSCQSGYQPNPSFCSSFNNVVDCSGKQATCTLTPISGGDITCQGNNGINTAIGCIPYNDTNALVGFFLRWAIGIGGGIAFLLIIFAGFMILSSSGNPERLKAGQELLTSAIGGLILLIFSIFVLRFIGINILGIFT